MNTPIDRAKAHFREVMDGGLRGPIRVDEWDLDIWFRPTMSLAQQSEVYRLTQENKHMDALIMTVIIRSLNEDGTPIFKKADKVELMRSVDPTVIFKIVDEMSDESHNREDLGN